MIRTCFTCWDLYDLDLKTQHSHISQKGSTSGLSAVDDDLSEVGLFNGDSALYIVFKSNSPFRLTYIGLMLT